ncbi:MAG: hypothetical protein EA383_02180 [Spirochaetaceae bacterium]|nr:MAG: hypothetical protein EA383_02180 [Spirochaetaceae bacterium]
MQRIDEVLTSMGCPKLNLLVRSLNDKVLAFYEHLGYAQDDSRSIGKRLISDL